MKCKDCRHGKRMTRRGQGCVDCLLYGMILLEDHECERKGCEPRDGDDDQREENGNETEVSDHGGGAFETVPGVL